MGNFVNESNFLQIILNTKGYVGNASFLNKLADLVTELKEKNPNLIYRTHLYLSIFISLINHFKIFEVCDPVLGDNGKLVYYNNHVAKLTLKKSPCNILKVCSPRACRDLHEENSSKCQYYYPKYIRIRVTPFSLFIKK